MIDGADAIIVSNNNVELGEYDGEYAHSMTTIFFRKVN